MTVPSSVSTDTEIEPGLDGQPRTNGAPAEGFDGTDDHPPPDPDTALTSSTELPTPGGTVGDAERAGDDDSGISGRFAGLVGASILSLFVFALLNWPDPKGWSDLFRPLLFLNTTPSGGDMGAHVWGPAFLRDELLPRGLLAGWTPDWYAGFPAYHFYMVVPSLAIVAVNAGLPWYVGVPLAALILYVGFRFSLQFETARNWIRALAVLFAITAVSVPYGVSFKLISVTGLVLFPLAAWAMGRLARAPEPVPVFLAMGAFIFLFDTNFTIYGGNIASTLAGEFAFSLSLCLTLLAIGMAIRGMDDQRWRAPAAVVIALVALCHIIPVFFLVPALVLAVLMHPAVPRAWAIAGIVAVALIPIAFADGTGLGVRGLAIVAVVVVIASAVVAEPTVLARARWLTFTGPTAAMMSAFWLVPFYLREPFFNDMGWERLEEIGPPMLTVPIKIALPVAALGVLLSFALRERIGMLFAGTGLLFAAAVANVGEGPLWNARLLPFYYLSVYLVAAVGVALAVRYIAAAANGELDRPEPGTLVGATAAALVAVLVAVAMPLRIMPFGQIADDSSGDYEWLFFSNRARSFIPGWADWNYSGYEEKSSYREYSDVVRSMDAIGEVRGCGRAMWEYEKGLDRYGTPMALMLLPHWTGGCIGSMEGLYFESSSTTPFHFLNQSALSEAPSRAQRDLPYREFDINRGIAQLQVMGVRYYLPQSDTAISAAREHPALTEVGEAQPFTIFEVAGSELVQGLDVEPIVTAGRTEEELLGGFEGEQDVSRFEVGWVSQAVNYYNDPAMFTALPAEDGPDSWQRSAVLDPVAGTAITPATVTDIDFDTNRLSFSVDEVGSPVLVKISYFPNWRVDGADGPWRVGPNLMAVVPTEADVTLSYGRTGVDYLGILLTLLGFVGLGLLAAMDRRRWLFENREVWDNAPTWDDQDLDGLGGPSRSEPMPPRPAHRVDDPGPAADVTDAAQTALVTEEPVDQADRIGLDEAIDADQVNDIGQHPEPTGPEAVTIAEVGDAVTDVRADGPIEDRPEAEPGSGPPPEDTPPRV